MKQVPTSITATDLEAAFDDIMDRVQEGEVFLIDEKVILTQPEDLSYLNDHYDAL